MLASSAAPPLTAKTEVIAHVAAMERGVASSNSSPRSLPPGIGTGWKPKFHATFTGNTLNTALWATCYPWAAGRNGCTNFGNPSERQWYLPSQARVGGGALRLVAQRGATRGTDRGGRSKTYACRSGMVTSYPGLRFQYGYLQVTARLPYASGMWPALWLAPANWQWPPEVDIIEHWDASARISQYLHAVGGTLEQAHEKKPNLSRGWHTFGLYWTKTRLWWYLDGKRVLATSAGIPRQPMYFLADLAIDKVPPAGTCSGTMLVRSVKLWQQS